MFCIHSMFSWLSALLFSTLLLLPMVDRYFDPISRTVVAEVESEPLPVLTSHPASWGTLFDALRKQYLDRHFGFRDLLISWNNYLDTIVLCSSTPSSRVLLGKDDWLFLAKDSAGRNIIEDAAAPAALSEVKLARVADELEHRRQWLAARGIRYLLVLTPNKNTVYPEKLPDAFQPADPGRHLRQLTAYLRSHTGLDVVDVTPALLERKKTEPVFYTTDSHWNAHGAFAAYEEIAKALRRDFPAITPLRRERFRVEAYDWGPGDLVFMMGLSDHFKEDRSYYFNLDWFKARGASYGGPMENWYIMLPQYSVTGNPALPRALVLHDSYWWELLPFVAECFDKALYVWSASPTAETFRHFDEALVERERPDIVIEEYTERMIMLSVH